MLESKRLIYKKFTSADLDRLIEMRVDDDVMKYLGGKKMQNPEALKHRLEYYISCYAKNIGMHAIIWKETGQMIGWSGLQPLEGTDEIEVSYGMVKEFWGRGIGFEAALFWLEYGFKEIGPEKIVAVADKENVGSWKIMEKLGMEYQKSEIHYGMECAVYEISRDSFLSNLAG
jgi:ribosomal-protein-alanine N-acetyltransferase